MPIPMLKTDAKNRCQKRCVYASALGIGFMVYNTVTEGYNHKYRRSDIFLPIGFVTSVYEVIWGHKNRTTQKPNPKTEGYKIFDRFPTPHLFFILSLLMILEGFDFNKI